MISYNIPVFPVSDLAADASLIAKWLACVYASMDKFSTDEEALKQLRSLPMILLVSGDFVALENTTVFFPEKGEYQLFIGGESLSDPNGYDHMWGPHPIPMVSCPILLYILA